MESPTIKSFKLRGTRITDAQLDARHRLWSTYGVDVVDHEVDLSAIFPGEGKIVAEIGFGMGEATITIAQNFPETRFLAIDVHLPGIGKVLSVIEQAKIANIRVMDEDAHLILGRMIPNDSLDGVHLFFPDPWPKTRHHKRRIVNESFINLVADKLKVGAAFNIATDWVPYAISIEETFRGSDRYAGGVIDRPDWRPHTRFEGQGISKDHYVTDFEYKKIK